MRRNCSAGWLAVGSDGLVVFFRSDLERYLNWWLPMKEWSIWKRVLPAGSAAEDDELFGVAFVDDWFEEVDDSDMVEYLAVYKMEY